MSEALEPAALPLPRPRIEAMTVVVPARNEEMALPHCLTALERALVEVAHLAPQVALRAVVVLDECTDASEFVVRSFARAARHRGLFDIDALPASGGCVGRTRALGFEHALAEAARAGTELDAVWLASTDADTIVPAHWLTAQLSRAQAGADVVVGTVEPDAQLGAREREAWMQRHQLEEDHPHVHGANLGVRASSYVAVGGFAPVAAHEDVDLVARLRARDDVEVLATDAHRVVTSSRLDGRAVGGFATYLADLRRTVT